MYNAMDIAQYIINYSIMQENPVSNLKLQKLLYYIQAAFLLEKEEPCFNENIVNWRHGPVVPEVYKKYKKYINQNIEDLQNGYSDLVINEEFELEYKKVIFNENCIDRNDKKIIQKVIDSFIDIDAWSMVEKTHEEDPWKLDSYRDDIIKNKSIEQYFKKNDNRKRIYGM